MDLFEQQTKDPARSPSQTAVPIESELEYINSWIDAMDRPDNVKSLLKEALILTCHPEMPVYSIIYNLDIFMAFYDERASLGTPRSTDVLDNPSNFVYGYMVLKLGMNANTIKKNSEGDPHFFENVFWMLQDVKPERYPISLDLESKGLYPVHKLIHMAWPMMQHQKDFRSRQDTLACLKFVFDKTPEESLIPIFKEHGEILAPMLCGVTAARVLRVFQKPNRRHRS